MKINELLEDASAGSSSAGMMALSAAMPLGDVVRRNTPATAKPKRKYANTFDTAKYKLEATKKE